MNTKLWVGLGILVSVLVLAACGDISYDAFLRISSDTEGGLFALVEPEGQPQISGEGNPMEYYIPFPDGVRRLAVTVTVWGDFKREESWIFETRRLKDHEYVVDVDQGHVTFLNDHYDDAVLWAWAVTGDPLTYTSRSKLEAGAAYSVQDIPANGNTTLSIDAGSYFIIVERVTGYFYSDTPVTVTVGEYSLFDVGPTNPHPSL